MSGITNSSSVLIAKCSGLPSDTEFILYQLGINFASFPVFLFLILVLLFIY